MSDEKDLEKTELVSSDESDKSGEEEITKTEVEAQAVEVKEAADTAEPVNTQVQDESDDNTGELKQENQEQPKKVKKPLSKGAIAGIVSGGIALVALIVCGIIFIPQLLKPDKDVVIDAAKETFAFSEDASYLEELIDVDAILDTYYEEGGELSIDLTVDSVTGYDELSGLTFSANDSYDPVNKLAYSTYSLLYDDVDILTINGAADEDNVYFMLQNVAETYFSLPMEDTFIALEESPLGQEMELSGMPSGGIDYFAAGSSEGVAVESEYVDAVTNIWDNAVFEKQKGKAKVTVNGNDITTKEYYITITEEDIKASLESFIDGVVAEISANPSMLESMEMDAATLETAVSIIKPEILSMIDEDLVIKVYISKGKIVKIVNEYSISYSGVNLASDFYLDIDENDMSGALTFNVLGQEVGITIDVDDVYGNPSGTITAFALDEEIVASFEATGKSSGSEETRTITGDVKYAGETLVTFNVDEKVSKDDNSYIVSYGMTLIDGSDTLPISFVMEGDYVDVKAGEKYTMNIDSLTISAMDQEIVSMSGAYTIDTTDVNPATIDGADICDLTTATSEDLESLIMDNQNKIINWIKEVITETGSLGELLDEYLFDGQLSSYLQFF